MIIINRSYIIHTEILHYLRSWGQEIISHHLHGNNSVLLKKFEKSDTIHLLESLYCCLYTI